jgi:hypothetical protein
MNRWCGPRRWLGAVAVLITSIAVATAACADTVTNWTASASNPPGGDGPVSVSAKITESTGTLTVQLTNLEANPTGAGQELSGILITFGTSLTTQTPSITATGSLIDIGSGGTIIPVSGTPNWGSSVAGTQVCLEAAGNCAPGGKPADMIIGPPGSNNLYSNANPSIVGHEPVIYETATFVLTISGLSATTPITAVQFQFGTGPDFHLGGTPVPGPVVGAGLPGLLVMGSGVVAWLRRRRKVMT